MLRTTGCRLLAAGLFLFTAALTSAQAVPPTPGRASAPALLDLPKPMQQPAKSAPCGASMKINISADGSKYVRWQQVGREQYLLHEARSYWGLLCSAGLAALSREVEQTLYTDVRAIGAWLRRYWGVDYSGTGLTHLRHRLGFSYQLPTPVPC